MDHSIRRLLVRIPLDRLKYCPFRDISKPKAIPDERERLVLEQIANYCRYKADPDEQTNHK